MDRSFFYLGLVAALCFSNELFGQDPAGQFVQEAAVVQQELVPDTPSGAPSTDQAVQPLPPPSQPAPALLEPISPPTLPQDDNPDSGLGGNDPRAEKLSLADVIASVYRYFPIIEQARLEAGVAGGTFTSAMGAYDTRLQAHSMSEPTGFYRNYRHGIGVFRQTWWGGYVSAGYRLGRGEYQPWYLERETNRGGEFSLGFGLPLLQGRAIDPQRVAVFQAGLAQQAVGPQVQTQLLNSGREAALLYWDWVAAGARLVAQEELVELAQDRQLQFEQGAEAGKFAQIDVVFNRQLLAERTSKKIEAEQKYREASFKLSLYLRDLTGVGLIPDDSWLPMHFPVIEDLPPADFSLDYQAALSRRPELAVLAIEAQHVRLDRQLANNQILPNLDLLAEAAQDVGQPTSSKNDKGQMELVLGVRGDLPIQRRGALGKVQQTGAKLAQIEQKTTLQRDKIAIELRTAHNALDLTTRRLTQVTDALEAAFDSLAGYRYAFQMGYADLLYLNILETKAAEVEILVVDAQRDWFVGLANMQAALGLDPLEQAINIANLPESKRLGPGDMPKAEQPVPENFQKDWQKRNEVK